MEKFFPLYFAGLWIVTNYILSKRGWAALAVNYRTDRKVPFFKGQLVSAGIKGISYRNCLLLICDAEGMHLRPMILFRLFHPPLFIPWKEIQQTGAKKIMFVSFETLETQGAPGTKLTLSKDFFQVIKPYLI